MPSKFWNQLSSGEEVVLAIENGTVMVMTDTEGTDTQRQRGLEMTELTGRGDAWENHQTGELTRTRTDYLLGLTRG